MDMADLTTKMDDKNVQDDNHDSDDVDGESLDDWVKSVVVCQMDSWTHRRSFGRSVS